LHGFVWNHIVLFEMASLVLLSLIAAASALPIPPSIFTLPVHSNSSQNTPDQAVALARQYYDNQTPVTPGLCDHYVGVWYGHSASGWPSAIDQWKGNTQPSVCFVTAAL
jgi:hypothetical protein